MDRSYVNQIKNDDVPSLRLGFIVQARIGSTRLPGKVLKDFYKEQSILDIIIKTIISSEIPAPFIIATGDDAENQPIKDFCIENKYPFFCGSEEDVLERFIKCADHFKLDYVIRICADNPMLDGILMKQLYTEGIYNPEQDYISFKVDNETPAIRSHWGLFTEWVKVSALKQISEQTADTFFHEHVTNYIYNHPESFKIHWIKAPDTIWEEKQMRFTIDTPDDFKNMQLLYQQMKKSPLPLHYKTLMETALKNPNTFKIMQSEIKKHNK